MKEVLIKLYTDRGVKRIAISYRIDNKLRGYNMPLDKFQYIFMKK